MPRKRYFPKIKRLLLQRRSQILEDVASELSVSTRAHVYECMDSPEMAAKSTDSAMVFQIVEMRSEELDCIEEALLRIEEGTYGECDACGKSISRARLEVLLSATLCIKCKAAEEAGELHVEASEVGDWERLADFERSTDVSPEVALDRGEKVS